MCYDYRRMNRDLEILDENFNIIESFTIGDSLMDKQIPCVRIGQGKTKILLAGAFHGLEYLTSAFLVKFLSELIVHIMTRQKMFGYDTERIFSEASIYVVPMVNPDGVDIAIHGIDITNPYHRALISMVGIHSFNRVWQSNARGVDLNHNYDAKWSMVIDKPSPTKYGGKYPESEPETRAVAELIRRENFDMLLTYHSQGKEIYYDFDGMENKRAFEVAKKMAEESGYEVCKPEGTAAFGGCKDWFIKEYGRLGFTVEIGSGQNPLPMSMLDDIYEENAKLTLCAVEEAIKDKAVNKKTEMLS